VAKKLQRSSDKRKFGCLIINALLDSVKESEIFDEVRSAIEKL
jgi:hypothetical protein